MKYISVGAVTKASTEQLVHINHYGYDYTLTGEYAPLWLDGRFRFDVSKNEKEAELLKQLQERGLVMLTDSNPTGEYRALTRVRIVAAKAKYPYLWLNKQERIALTWIREAGLVLSFAELVYLMDQKIAPEPRYLGHENVQCLVERIYARENIFDNILENQMEQTLSRDEVVNLILRLLKKKRIVLL